MHKLVDNDTRSSGLSFGIESHWAIKGHINEYVDTQQ